MISGNGRKAKAPCGCLGEVVIGTFVRCLQGCGDDSKAKPTTFVSGVCPKCTSTYVKKWVPEFSAYGGLYSFFPAFNRVCEPCGTLWCENEDEGDDGG